MWLLMKMMIKMILIMIAWLQQMVLEGWRKNENNDVVNGSNSKLDSRSSIEPDDAAFIPRCVKVVPSREQNGCCYQTRIILIKTRWPKHATSSGCNTSVTCGGLTFSRGIDVHPIAKTVAVLLSFQGIPETSWTTSSRDAFF